ncbi:MAG: glycosyltransferase family 2 protein [Verrucomicrobiota bacterium]
MKASIIIPVHNRREITLRSLRSLKEASLSSDFGIIVVDDGSTDGTAEAIAAEFPQVRVVVGDGELYWTGGIRSGMQQALLEGAGYLFWLNDDCLLLKGTLEQMLKYLCENPRTVCGTACFIREGGRPVQTAFRGRSPVSPDEEVTEVDGMSGYCVGMPASLCEEIGLPDAERMPHYGADNIYTLLAKRKGYRVVLLRSAKAILLDETPTPSIGQRARLSKESLGGFLVKTFFRKKSPYFLKGQYWYHRYKYGGVLGSVLFLLKVWNWVSIAAFHLAARLRPVRPSAPFQTS